MQPTTQAQSAASDLLQSILPALNGLQGPDHHGDYTAWCPFHRDSRDDVPQSPDLSVSEDGFHCSACNAGGSLAKLADELRSAMDSATPRPRTPGPLPGIKRDDPPRPAALFDGLVDVVKLDGAPAFLVRAGSPADAYEPRVVTEATIRGTPVVPPELDAIPWLLPRAREVLRHYAADTDAALYADIASHLAAASRLPDPALYGLLALWVMHTYLLEQFHYSPIICLHGLPERGKSRTGRALIHVAYRGLHVPCTRHSFISRLANDFRGTLFFDLRDIWRKLVRDSSEEVVLQRFERDVYVPRVERPAAGPHRDTRYYPVFGPTIIATNVAPDDMLESRGLTITMPEAEEDFPRAVTPRSALPLKERLVAFRARHMDRDLPDAPKLVRGRLGDILLPLARLQRLVAPDFEGDLHRLAEAFHRERILLRGHSPEASVIAALLALRAQVREGALPLRMVGELVNRDRPGGEKLGPQRLSRILRTLGLRTRHTMRGAVIEYSGERVDLIARRHGVSWQAERCRT